MAYHDGLVRSLTRQLNQLREADGNQRMEDIARTMRCSQAKVSRMFSARRPIVWNDLQALIAILHADPLTRRRIEATWEAINASKPTFASWGDVLTKPQQEYFEALQWADVVRLQANGVVPELLRVPEYHAAMNFDRDHDERRWKDLLPHLQARRNPDQLIHVVMDESVFIRYAIPGFHDQLDALLDAHSNGVQIQVFPFRQGIHPAILSIFSILSFRDDPEADCWSTSGHHAPISWVTDPERQALLTRVWDDVLGLCTAPLELPAIIERAHRQSKGSPRTVVAG